MNAQAEHAVSAENFKLFPADEEFEIKVPASIANLGPGFETLAVAVQLYVVLRVKKIPGNGQVEFQQADAGSVDENLIERAYRYVAGARGQRLPSLSVEVSSEIPVHAGLGSRAAAIVAGLRLYDAVAGLVPIQELLRAACALGCHPDRAAASLLGGLTLSCQLPDGSIHATKFPWPDALGLAVLTPSSPRRSNPPSADLPASVSRADLVFNLQRVALFLQSLRSSDFSLLKHAMDDRVHQPFRHGLGPELNEALQIQHQDLLGMCLSGSGPSLVALAERNLWEIGDLLVGVYQRAGIGCQLRILDVHQEVSSYSKLFRSGLLCCS